MAWSINLGRCPTEAIGRRVRVELENGRLPDGTWAADGRTGCDWTLTGHPFDIKRFEVVR